MKKRVVQQRVFHILIVSLTILLIGGGIALLCQWSTGPVPGRASSDSVIGPPSLPAASVDAIFRRVGSPMVGTGQTVEAAARTANIDDAFALAVWWTETNDGGAGVGRADRNPGSVRGSIGYPSAYDGYTIYPSYTAAVNYWFPLLKRNYIKRGLATVSAIAHPYVGTSTSYLWASKVTTLMNRYRKEAPTPTATPGQAQPTSVSLQRVQQSLAGKQREQTTKGIPATVAPASQPQSEQSTLPSSGIMLALLLLLCVLIAILGFGAQTRQLRKRSAARLARQPFAQPAAHLWSDLHASQQPPAAFFGQQFSGALLPLTEDLPLSIVSPNTSGLFAPVLPERRSASRVFSPGHSPQSLRALPFSSGQSFFNAPDGEPVEQRSFAVPVMPGGGHLAFPDAHPPVHSAMLVPGGLCPNRLQSTAAATYADRPDNQTPAWQRQAVGGKSTNERSGGLLSRYRETQAWSQRVD
ncbi:MAG TPA: hypothetical protein VGF67_03870 [Ktedonobacteraceae bacterium]|jgi:hypothetical protein